MTQKALRLLNAIVCLFVISGCAAVESLGIGSDSVRSSEADPVSQETDASGLPSELTQNPGCGVSRLSKSEKIERNRKMALMLHMSYRLYPDDPGATKHGLERHGCTSEPFTMMFGMYTPPPSDPFLYHEKTEGLTNREIETLLLRSNVPDFESVPGSFRAIPFEEGVFFAHSYRGTNKDGEPLFMWEVGLLLVSDEGRITHMDWWNDTIGADQMMKAGFGHGLDFFKKNPDKYHQVVGEKLEQLKLQSHN